MNWDDALEIWRARLAAKSLMTARQYYNIVKAHSVNAPPLDQLTQLDLERMADMLAMRSRRIVGDLSSGSANKYSQGLRMFFLFCVKRGWVTLTSEQVREALPPISARVQRPYNILSSEEQAALLSAASRSPWPERDYGLVICMLGSGLRASEALALCRKDICHDEHGFYIDVRQGKMRRDRQVPISQDVYNSLVAIDERNGRLFGMNYSNLHRIIARLVRAAGISKRISAHSLRHTYAMDLLRDPVTGQPRAPIPIVAKMIGDTIQSTSRYVDHFERADLARWAPSFRR